MTIFVLLLSIAAGLVALWAFNRMIEQDGLGHRPPPPSHVDDVEPRSSRQWAVLSR